MDSTLTDPLAGTVLERRYRITGRIARGGMSTVYEAVDARLDRTVAVKVMHPHLADDEEFVARFIREARAVARLSSPHIVPVYDQGSHDGLAYLVMELVPGRTLRDLLTERGALSPELALSLLEPVLIALAAAHRAGYVHRDVKPENVLLGDDGTVKVTDFGLARAVEAAASTSTRGMLLGTMAYVAPEQVDDGPVDERTDVYAAGLLAFELLTGTVPFAGGSPLSIAVRRTHEDVPPPSMMTSVPAELDELVLWATRREPGARPADAGVLLAQLRTVRDDLGLHAVPVPAALGTSGPAMSTPTVAQPRRGLVAAEALHGEVHDAGDWRPLPARQDRGGARTRRRRRPGGGVIATVVVVVLAVLLAGGGWWLGSGRYTTVPSYYGLTEQQASQRITSDGFSETTGPAEFSESVAKGDVVAQEPGQQDRILRHGTVTLHLSKGPERYIVPTLAGKDLGTAQQRLSELHLTSSTTQAYSSSIGVGEVVSSDPAPGASLRRDTVVHLVVSKGPPPVKVPDLTRGSAEEAKQTLTSLGLKATVTQAYDKTVAEGDVISQNPTDGTLTRGSTVALIVSKGPPLVPLPDVTGQSRDEARDTLRADGFDVRVFGGPGRVVQMSPGGGGQAPYGSRITLLTLL